MTSEAEPQVRAQPVSRIELVALLATLSATVAFSIDAMLPALPEIGTALAPADPQRSQLIIATFVLGLGAGTLFAGPLSDAFGRRPVAVAGAVIYTLAALYASVSNDLDAILVARVVQGLGASGPRVIAVAIARDLFSGRQMARIVSFAMMIFTLVPVFAPTLGAGIAWAFGWRAIFVSFAVFSVISISWLLLRLPETLRPEFRRRFRPRAFAVGMVEVLSNRQALLATLVQTLLFAMLFAVLMSSQAVIGGLYDRTASFPLWFGVMAALSATSSLLNALVVVRFGMRNVVAWGLGVQAVLTLIFLLTQFAVWGDTAPPFAVALLWMTSVFFLAGLGIGNTNAIALEPMGHMAGMASSVVSSAATMLSAILAAFVGQMFDGTMLPLTAGVLVFGVAATGLTVLLKNSDD